MSEYQYYEFQAIDRPLTKEEMAELRGISSRATITPRMMRNVYNYGDFRGEPRELVEQYFDGFVYDSNFGLRTLMLRLPRRLVDLSVIEPYSTEEGFTVFHTADHVIFDFECNNEEGGSWVEQSESEAWLPALLPIRDEIARGDLRALYLGWLRAVQRGILADEDEEPPVPPGLGQLSATQSSLAEFLELDDSLIAVAAKRSGPLPDRSILPGEFEGWIRALPEVEKTSLLLRALQEGVPSIRLELERAFHLWRAPAFDSGAAAGQPARHVGEIFAASEELAEARAREAAEARAQEAQRKKIEAAAARTAHLDRLVGREADLWQKIDDLLATKRPTAYPEVIQVVIDLRDLAKRGNDVADFQRRLTELRARHVKKLNLIERLNSAGLLASRLPLLDG